MEQLTRLNEAHTKGKGARGSGLTRNVVIYLTVLLSILLVCQTSMAQSRLRLKNGHTIRNLQLTQVTNDKLKFYDGSRELLIQKSSIKWFEANTYLIQFDTGEVIWMARKCNDDGFRQISSEASINLLNVIDTGLNFQKLRHDSIGKGGPVYIPKRYQKFNGVKPTVKLMHYHRLTPANQFLFPIGHLWATGVAGTFAGLFGGLAGVFYSGVLVAEPRDIAAGYRIGAFLGAATGSSFLSHGVHGHANGLASILGALSGVALAYSLDSPPNNLIYLKPFLPALCAFSLNEIVLWYKIHRHPHIRLWQIGSK